MANVEVRELSLEETIVDKLIERGLHVACAESCTGGMIASTLVNVSGVSEVMNESYITYSNEAKRRLLQVKEDALSRYGAVSRQVAQQMAVGAAGASGADVSIAVTGIAGPSGGTEEKPVGLVYIGCSVCGNVVVTENHFQGNRTQVREQTTQAALKLLLEMLS